MFQYDHSALAAGVGGDLYTVQSYGRDKAATAIPPRPCMT